MSAIPTEKPTPAGGRPTVETIDEEQPFPPPEQAPGDGGPDGEESGPRHDDVWGNDRNMGQRNGLSPLLAGIEVTLSVEIGSHRLPLRELMTVDPGQIFALDRMTNEPVCVLVNGKPFARGEIVAMGDRFGVRIVELSAGGAGA